MEHNDIRHKLSEYIDGSITAEERTVIEAHLTTCSECKDALHELRNTIEHIKTVEGIEPPAWMKQKIMAAVRAGVEEKKGLFHRFFFPLHIKLPIQAVAVLFLAVTAFYINQQIQRIPERSEAPFQEFAARTEAPPAGAAQDKLAEADVPAGRSKKIPQEQAYKALDMKPAYGTPPPPMLRGRAAAPTPAPAQPAEPPVPEKHEVTAKQNTVDPHAAEGLLHDEERHEPAPSKRKAITAREVSGAGSGSAPAEITLTVSVKNSGAAKDIETTIKQLDGTIITTMRLDAKRIYIISLDAHRANDLVQELKRMGDLKEKDLVLEPREGRVVFRIELNRPPKAAVGC